jgi:hypothetical protein
MQAITTIGFDIAKSVLLMLAAKWLFAGSWTLRGSRRLAS